VDDDEDADDDNEGEYAEQHQLTGTRDGAVVFPIVTSAVRRASRSFSMACSSHPSG